MGQARNISYITPMQTQTYSVQMSFIIVADSKDDATKKVLDIIERGIEGSQIEASYHDTTTDITGELLRNKP